MECIWAKTLPTYPIYEAGNSPFCPHMSPSKIVQKPVNRTIYSPGKQRKNNLYVIPNKTQCIKPTASWSSIFQTASKRSPHCKNRQFAIFVSNAQMPNHKYRPKTFKNKWHTCTTETAKSKETYLEFEQRLEPKWLVPWPRSSFSPFLYRLHCLPRASSLTTAPSYFWKRFTAHARETHAFSAPLYFQGAFY